MGMRTALPCAKRVLCTMCRRNLEQCRSDVIACLFSNPSLGRVCKLIYKQNLCVANPETAAKLFKRPGREAERLPLRSETCTFVVLMWRKGCSLPHQHCTHKDTLLI